jgi:hypothetical protein
MLRGAVPLASRPCFARRGRTLLRPSRPMASTAELHQDPPPVPAEMAAPYRDGCTSLNRATPQVSSCYPKIAGARHLQLRSGTALHKSRSEVLPALHRSSRRRRALTQPPDRYRRRAEGGWRRERGAGVAGGQRGGASVVGGRRRIRRGGSKWPEESERGWEATVGVRDVRGDAARRENHWICGCGGLQPQNADAIVASAAAATVVFGSAFGRCRSYSSSCWRQSKALYTPHHVVMPQNKLVRTQKKWASLLSGGNNMIH